MSYFLRALLIRRIAESGPAVTVTKIIKEWDGTISTVTVFPGAVGDWAITYPDGVMHTVTLTYLDSITVTTTEQ